MTPLLELAGLRAVYGRSEVVRGLSLTVGEGEIVALLGPNGAGKKTTLLTASGLLASLGGTIRLFGAAVDARAPFRSARRGLALVTEDRSLFSALSVAENLRLARSRRGRLDVLDYFPALGPLRNRRAGLLSGGEQQMLAIARALAMRPRLLMIDEMSMGLAPVVLERIAAVVRRIADEMRIGVLLVEQHLPVALSIADSATLLRHGQVVTSGTAAELRSRPEVMLAGYFGAGESSPSPHAPYQ